MTEVLRKLVIGSLLHDIGKVVYRSGDGRNHSQSGYEFLRDNVEIKDGQILDCVRYHHGSHLKDAMIADDNLAYITYFADNVASAVDRRNKDDSEGGFDKTIPLDSVFNILNGNHDNYHYARHVLRPESGINYPTDKKIEMDQHFYSEIVRLLEDNLKSLDDSDEYIQSLLSVLEATLSYIPSSTAKNQLADISLYDHVKITAAIAECVLLYLGENTDYKEKLFKKAAETYKEKMFLLYAMDISGIQSFIYDIGSKSNLRGLRARSFYLEIVMEHMIDELLTNIGLSRANLIYTGGGHCYVLLPNTETVKRAIEAHESSVNDWFLDTFGISLYVAGGWSECSSMDLKNEPEGSYQDLYRAISKKISEKKMHRYNAGQILKLSKCNISGQRECKICRRIDRMYDEDICSICASMLAISKSVLYEDFFAVMGREEPDSLPLPFDKYLVGCTENELKKYMNDLCYVRSYSKNRMFTGKSMTTKLWVGSYTTGDTFEDLAKKAKGIKRIAVLRADVDNLGQTIVSGFQTKNGSGRYMTLSRTATLSRQLSLFFKCYINEILGNGDNDFLDGSKERNTTIVYSGGDDIFLVGAWNDVIEIFADIREAFKRYTQGTITISGGIGLYQSSYPVNIMAKETAILEDTAKHLPGKDGICLFDPTYCFPWKTYMEDVIGEKLETLKAYFDHTETRGNSFLYHLLELIRNSKDKINIARYVYLLSRMEPDKDDNEQWQAYRVFSEKMYAWLKDSHAHEALEAAIYLYVYMNRSEDEL